MILTREKAIQKCRDMWNWIADETEKRKEYVSKGEYFWVNQNFCVPACYCYLCEYSDDCYDCPLDFGEDGPYACESEGSPYWQWRQAKNWELRASLARQIANLPEKEV